MTLAPGRPAPFRITADLPRGITVLEASAGTGKTFTIAALVARYLAEGTPVERLLVVSFTRMATGELRERVRERLVSAEAGLARAVDGAAPDGGDELLRVLADADGAERVRRRDRLARALADFDAATITTIHGFCQHVLSGLGVTGDVEREVTLLPDPGELVADIVDDLYVRRFLDRDHPPFRRADALAIAEAAIANPFAPIEPRAAPHDSTPAMRARFARAVREELSRRTRRAGVLTYDDLLGRLRETLEHPERGPAACARLRGRYAVVLVDEFQDTDPVQWDIFRRAFGDGGGALVLIGDPKQAIYAFRGADVHAYLAASRAADRRATLDVNHRSDPELLRAFDALFHGVRLGHAGIAYRPVTAAPARVARLTGAPAPAALRLRVLRRDAPGITLTARTREIQVDSARAVVARDVAAEVVGLLGAGARLRDAAGVERALRPGDVAVLVRTHRQATLARDALEAARVPAVIAGVGSVFATEGAAHWRHLLEALERPGAADRLAAAALTPFVGWDAARLAGATEERREELAARLHAWADLARRRGVAALAARIDITQGVAARLLGREDGERELTDLRHVAELLHAAAGAEGLGVAALGAWLSARIAEAGAEGEGEGMRRLESDAEAVQVLTIHGSKGLEFPVVHAPFLWDFPAPRDDGIPVYHDPGADDRRTIDVGGPGSPRRREHLILWASEERGEDLRLAYVALTRARHVAVVWWAGTQRARDAPLCRLLFAVGEGGEVGALEGPTPADAAVEERLDALAAMAPGCIAVERVAPSAGASWAGPGRRAADLDAAPFARRLDTGWRRTSYSGITARRHEAPVGSEPEAAVVADEPGPGRRPPAVDDDPGAAALRGHALPLDAMPAGVEIGTFVHSVLEHADFAAPDLAGELGPRIDEARARGALDVGDPALVATGLAAAIATPLGPLAGELRLRDLARADRRDELRFELPLVGGDAPHGAVAVADVAALADRHLGAGDPLAGYGERLADPLLGADLRGYLVGSLDLVARLPDGRFAIIDHKTNRLGAPEAPASAWDYRPQALAREMADAHYGLQALLYSVALHRYLRWRLPAYAPDRHLAGVLYLFLRGMTGPDVPRVAGAPCGVFAWRPPTALVTGLSDLLDVGAAA